jgi:hypothetical protein
VKRGDLIRHVKGRQLAIVLRDRPARDPEDIHSYIDLLWLDDGGEDSAYSGLFEVISAAS